ncbi:Zinc finger protein 511 [Escovopsis weberi]|uniref:Zinc finger protein 511 n=1 Tax=Escovopsis weberi TaxID=150374 RepID=A0A0M9VU25_ESCWE|nr:Zinc finger protein 511 [Escovopsis weberi]
MKRSREPEEHLEPGAGETQCDEPPADEQPRHVKTPTIDDGDEDGPEFAMRCSLPPHREAIGFRSYGDYEAHYQRDHTNRCLECRRNFPTEHLLGIHIEECHDPLARVARERGEHTYSCFVEGCARKCMTPQKRRLHLIDKHSYPKNFFFAVTKQGVDGRRSLLNESGAQVHRRRSSSGAAQQAPKGGRRGSTQEPSQAPAGRQGARAKPKSKPKPDSESEPGPAMGAVAAAAAAEVPVDGAEKTQQDVEMAELTGAMSALQFVPPSVRFGRGRAGFSRR